MENLFEQFEVVIDHALTIFSFVAFALIILASIWSYWAGKKEGKIAGEIKGFQDGKGLPRPVQCIPRGCFEVKHFLLGEKYEGTSQSISNYVVVYDESGTPFLIVLSTAREIPTDAKYLNKDEDGWYFSSKPFSFHVDKYLEVENLRKLIHKTDQGTHPADADSVQAHNHEKKI